MLMLGLCSLIAVGVLVIGGLGNAAITRGGAQSAADLAALAGSQVLLDQAWGAPVREPCPVSERIAGANGGVVVACDHRSEVVCVTVQRAAWFGIARASACAGPPQ